jgi:hypothetical protein
MGAESSPVLLWLLAHRALNPPPLSSSLAEEERLCSLLLRVAARDFRRSQLSASPRSSEMLTVELRPAKSYMA